MSLARGFTILAAAALLARTNVARATATPERLCQSGRTKATAKYTSCAQTALAKFDLTDDDDAGARAAGKCVTKYAATWAKLQAKASGTGDTCDHARFVDNGDGTITDLLTALQWEKKENLDGTPNLADPHDGDNQYFWSVSGTAADGPAFTSFLAALDSSGGCFVGQCDWRLPTRDELLTTVTPTYPACLTGPCIDPAFGPTAGGYYWSATTNPLVPTGAWFVSYDQGWADYVLKSAVQQYVRAVRSGL